jgi:predicted nucleic acid-binding protein
MLGIDTNVVMRLLVSDDAEQTRRARKLIEQSLGREEPVLVSLLVLIESEWVLRSSYGFKRDAVLGMFRALLSSARRAVRIAGGTEASAQCFDEPNGNVRFLAFEQRRALIGNQQLLTRDQRSQWPAHTAFVFAHRIFPALECILLSTFLERDLLSH